MFIVWDSRGKRLTNNIRFHINKQFNTNVQYTYSIPWIIHGICFNEREQCNPKVKVTLDLNFPDCCTKVGDCSS